MIVLVVTIMCPRFVCKMAKKGKTISGPKKKNEEKIGNQLQQSPKFVLPTTVHPRACTCTDYILSV